MMIKILKKQIKQNKHLFSSFNLFFNYFNLNKFFLNNNTVFLLSYLQSRKKKGLFYFF
jgi:hypothetical protein